MQGEFSAAGGASRLKLVADGETLVFEVPGSSGWDSPSSTDVGEINFAKPGVYHVILEPADPENWKPVNAWGLQFEPKE